MYLPGDTGRYLHGGTVLPTRGRRFSYTRGLISLHGGFGFPTRRNEHCRLRTAYLMNSIASARLWYNMRREICA